MCFSDTYRFDPADVIFEVARDLGMRLVFCRGGGTMPRPVDGERPLPFEPLDAMIKSIAACAQRFHDAAPDSMRRVAFAPTAPPWSVKPDELKVIAAAARGLGLRLPQPFVRDPRLRGVLPEHVRQAPGAVDCRA